VVREEDGRSLLPVSAAPAVGAAIATGAPLLSRRGVSVEMFGGRAVASLSMATHDEIGVADTISAAAFASSAGALSLKHMEQDRTSFRRRLAGWLSRRANGSSSPSSSNSKKKKTPAALREETIRFDGRNDGDFKRNRRSAQAASA